MMIPTDLSWLALPAPVPDLVPVLVRRTVRPRPWVPVLLEALEVGEQEVLHRRQCRRRSCRAPDSSRHHCLLILFLWALPMLHLAAVVPNRSLRRRDARP